MNSEHPEGWTDATRIPSAGEDEVGKSQVESCPTPSPTARKCLNFCAHVDFLPFFWLDEVLPSANRAGKSQEQVAESIK